MALTYERVLKGTIAIVAVSMSLYHLYVAFTGAPQAFFFRGTHLLFAMVLVFLLYPSLAGATNRLQARFATTPAEPTAPWDSGGHRGLIGSVSPLRR